MDRGNEQLAQKTNNRVDDLEHGDQESAGDMDRQSANDLNRGGQEAAEEVVRRIKEAERTKKIYIKTDRKTKKMVEDSIRDLLAIDNEKARRSGHPEDAKYDAIEIITGDDEEKDDEEHDSDSDYDEWADFDPDNEDIVDVTAHVFRSLGLTDKKYDSSEPEDED